MSEHKKCLKDKPRAINQTPDSHKDGVHTSRIMHYQLFARATGAASTQRATHLAALLETIYRPETQRFDFTKFQGTLTVRVRASTSTESGSKYRHAENTINKTNPQKPTESRSRQRIRIYIYVHVHAMKINTKNSHARPQTEYKKSSEYRPCARSKTESDKRRNVRTFTYFSTLHQG